MSENILVATLYLKNGIVHESDPEEVPRETYNRIVREVIEALSGEDGVLQFSCKGKLVLISNTALQSASFDYQAVNDDSDYNFGGA